MFWLSGRVYLDAAKTVAVPGGVLGNAAHFLTFAALAGGLSAATNREGLCVGLFTRTGAAAFAAALLYAFVDETRQYLTPGRTCSLYDIGLDGLGAAAALLLPEAIYRRVRLPWAGNGRPRGMSAFAACLAAALLVGLAGSGRPWPDRALEDWLRTWLPR